MVKIIIDSGADQNTWLQEKFDYDFIPLSIIVDGEAYLDRHEMSLENLHEAMKAGKMPSTSQPSPGQIQAILDKYREQGEDVLIISLWKQLSGTFQVIQSVVNDYKENYPDFNIEVVDSNSATVSETIIAIQALEMSKAGYSFEDVVEQARWNADHMAVYLTVEKLDWLVKGGRLSKAAGYIGTALNVKPILSVDDEKLYSTGVVRGKNRVYSRMAEKVKDDSASFPNQLICISHVDQEENARKLEELIKNEIPEAKTMIFEFGAVLAAHIGLGGVAVAALTDKPEIYILSED